MSVKPCTGTSTASGLEGQTIDAGRLLLVRVLGEGAYGVVYLAVEQQNTTTGTSRMPSPKQYAVKVLPKAESSSLIGECQSREIVAHKIVSGHPSVVSLHEVIEDDQFIFLVMDYCSGGDLYNAVVERRIFEGNNALLKSAFLQIIDAVEWCHDLGIYHRDLKPDNIFISADGSKVYLGDFGLATDQNLSNNHKCGSSFYMSPECIGEEQNFGPYKNQVSDIWSLGVIFTNMVTGRSPWRRATTDDDHFHHYLCEPDHFIRTVLPMSDAAGEVFKRIFTFNPYRRISLVKLREAVAAIDTFFPSSAEVDSAVRDKRVLDATAWNIARAKSTPATPDLPQGVAEDWTKVGAYPDDEFLFPSPNPDNFDMTPMSQPTTPAADVSSSSTLCDSDDVFAEQYAEKLGTTSPNPTAESHVASRDGAADGRGFSIATVNRLLERWVL